MMPVRVWTVGPSPASPSGSSATAIGRGSTLVMTVRSLRPSILTRNVTSFEAAVVIVDLHGVVQEDELALAEIVEGGIRRGEGRVDPPEEEPTFLVTSSMVQERLQRLPSGSPPVTPDVATPTFDAKCPWSARSTSVNPSETAAVSGTDDPVVFVGLGQLHRESGGGANSGASLRPVTLMVTVWVSKAPCSSVTWMSKVSNTTCALRQRLDVRLAVGRGNTSTGRSG